MKACPLLVKLGMGMGKMSVKRRDRVGFITCFQFARMVLVHVQIRNYGQSDWLFTF